MTALPIDAIEVRERSRVGITNLDSLAKSISERGLLHPPAVRLVGDAWVLIAGQRRLEAVRLLNWTTVPVTVAESVLDELAALEAEGDENTEREPFTPEEAVRHRKRIERLVAAQAKERQAAAIKERDEKGRAVSTGSKLEQVGESKPADRKTRARTAKGTGYSATTLDKAEKVVEAAEAKPALRPLVDEMNTSGKVDAAFKALKVLEAKEQAQQVEEFVDHAIANSPDVAQAFLAGDLSKFRLHTLKGVNRLDPAECARLIERSDLDLADQWAEKCESWFSQFRDALSRPLHIVKENAQ